MQISLVVQLWSIELSLLDLYRDRSLSSHLVKFGKKFLGNISLVFVKSLDSRFYLLNRVKFESLLVNWIHKLVHPIKEHPNVLFNLLVAH